jgi:lauroyl/myristoyl acyltransferase
MSERPHRESPVPASSPAASSNDSPAASSFGQRVVSFWLKALFFTAEHAPWMPRLMSGVVRRGVLMCVPSVRQATLANAARILGPQSTPKQRTDLARGVVDSFFRFCLDVGRSAGKSPEDLVAEITRVEGREHYDRARASGKGLIIATAHMGSFEVGMAGLAMQGQKLHVIFQRDREGLFERQRSSLRERLGVIESPIDNGWTMWISLRDALLRGEAVVMQADRVMPGQRGVKMPFLHGTLEMPPGPAKLARVSGAWIVPIFSVREADGRIRLCIEPPITPADDVDDSSAAATRHADPLLQKLAKVVAKYVRAYPEQWLMFHPAFIEDQPAANAAAKDTRS